MRSFNLGLAQVIADVLVDGSWPLVIGGDCSVLLGALAGIRRSGPVSLVHVDGHSDFRHPGNYDPATMLGAVAGMDLALATGRGEPIMTDWPGVKGPLVPDEQVVQLGERENRDEDFAWPDVNETAINRIDVFEARERGAADTVVRIKETLDQKPTWPFWLHLDVDVLDQRVMPAVDAPGSPGIDPDELVFILREVVGDRRCIGMTVTVFDPDLDSDGRFAELVVELLRQSLPAPAPASQVSGRL